MWVTSGGKEMQIFVDGLDWCEGAYDFFFQAEDGIRDEIAERGAAEAETNRRKTEDDDDGIAIGQTDR